MRNDFILFEAGGGKADIYVNTNYIRKVEYNVNEDVTYIFLDGEEKPITATGYHTEEIMKEIAKIESSLRL